jgi:hypothetical protein
MEALTPPGSEGPLSDRRPLNLSLYILRFVVSHTVSLIERPAAAGGSISSQSDESGTQVWQRMRPGAFLGSPETFPWRRRASLRLLRFDWLLRFGASLFIGFIPDFPK